MSDERVAVLHHVSVEDLGPTDSRPLSENVLGVRRTCWEFFPSFGRCSSKIRGDSTAAGILAVLAVPTLWWLSN
jgi:hypothetical protein